MERRLRIAWILAISLAGGLLVATPASASYHLMKIREVHEGPGATGDYVELQMYAAGQNFVSGRHVVTYDGGGAVFSNFTFPANVPNGDSQRTILVANDASVAGADFLAPLGLNVVNSGTVCFTDTSTAAGIDCVSYGSPATPPVGPPSPVGAPVALPGNQLAEGQSIHRNISRGCATLLEAGDDTSNSATDFALGTPSPRSNSVAPTEKECTGGGTSGAPETTITKAPKNKTAKPKANYKFESSEPSSTFECALDRQIKVDKFKDCESPFKKKVDDGKHKFQVAAIDAEGNVDPSPAQDKFKVLR